MQSENSLAAPRLAIVILNYNGAGMLQRFLPSVLNCSGGAEVIVADNASTDNSLEVMHEEFPHVRRIEMTENYGFADGYNRALQQVEAEYFLLLNSDVEVTPGWAQTLLEYMDAHPEVAACQPKVLQYPRPEDGPAAFEYAGAAGGYIDRYGYPYCRGRVMGSVEKDHGQYDTEATVFWATGAALLIRARDWREVGGLDGSFFAHQEEIDLCWRLRARGRLVSCCPQAVVYHVGGGTLPQGSPRKTYLNFRNNLFLLYKNLPEEELRHVLRVRRVLDAIAALKELFTLNLKNYKAIRQARHDFHTHCHDYDEVRAHNLNQTTLYNIRERTRVSLLLQYYLLGRKTYERLQ